MSVKKVKYSEEKLSEEGLLENSTKVSTEGKDDTMHTLDPASIKIMENYKAMILTIDYMRKKMTTPSFRGLQEGVENITGDRFITSDLEDVVSVYPERFDIAWRRIATEKGSGLTNELCVYINLDNRTITQHLQDFRTKLMEGNIRVNYEVPVEPIVYEQKKTKLKSALAASATERAASLMAPTLTIDEWRDVAEKRGQLAANMAKSELDKVKAVAYAHQIESLPRVCNALRSMCAQIRKTIFSMKELNQKLAQELELTPRDLRIRLDLLAHVLPEFLTIFPPDEYISHESVKVNMDVPYATLKQSLLKLKVNHAPAAAIGQGV